MRIVNLGAHATLALLVVRFLSWRGVQLIGALLGGLFVFVSPVGIANVAGNDTISMTLATLFGSLGMWSLRPENDRVDTPSQARALAFFAAALLSKESAFGYLPILMGLSTFGSVVIERRRLMGMRTSMSVLSFLLVAILMWSWRRHLGADMPDLSGRGQMQLGSNLLINLAELWGVAVTPVPTTLIYQGVVLHRWLWPALGALGACVILVILVLGNRSQKERRAAMFYLATGSVVLGPVLLLKHVGEGYAYSILPFIGILFGTACANLVAGRWGVSRLVVAGVVLLALGETSRWDATAMAANGRAATSLMNQFVQQVGTLPEDGTLVCINPASKEPSYSVYRMSGFSLIDHEPDVRYLLTGRADVKVFWLLDHGFTPNEARYRPPLPCTGCIFITVIDDTVIARTKDPRGTSR